MDPEKTVASAPVADVRGNKANVDADIAVKTNAKIGFLNGNRSAETGSTKEDIYVKASVTNSHVGKTVVVCNIL